ncbi:glycosyltransferase [Flavobacterium sp. F-380]|uniref:Glycosyltransferase n=1 Tax=Flavobacterium kayseriense TaxID=2764714 RepID=A0ABR7J8A9_9FLAO|nr:glycosyltransferase [Flavobacterium kayseriense]MBC5841417.1 glycosyltransferase [Flavobacterium kayseriense]MBC5847945.1 glycosyltransferase [Flavobacterium kayseriense]
MINLKEFITANGEVILYTGNPNFDQLEDLSKGAGDIWHSSFEQGYKNAFPELVYQTAVFFWYLNDFNGLDQCVSWRVNPNAFAVRKSVWELTKGFDTDYENIQMQALEFGFRCNRFLGAVPLYVKNLFSNTVTEDVRISRRDRHVFFRKNYKSSHALYMIFRMGFWRINEWVSFFKSKKRYEKKDNSNSIPPRQLQTIEGRPTVSYIIPTMFRQEYTVQLLDDLSCQSYKPTEVIVVDATPETIRNENAYQTKKYPFELKIIWQQSKGSCRARNEAISASTGEYIVFGDDDIRIPQNFIENHIRFLQTYKVGACNGLDILADHYKQDLYDLQIKIENCKASQLLAGCSQMFSNANSCVKREFVNQLIGNDVNFDGGYGEDSDFGMSLSKIGVIVLANPFAVNLHLKPPSGGYRFWGNQARIVGKKRKSQPWELDIPVGIIKPIPSPTVMYGIMKHYNADQLTEYKYKHFLHYVLQGKKSSFLYRFLRIPYKNIQFKKSVFYAQRLLNLGIRHQ